LAEREGIEPARVSPKINNLLIYRETVSLESPKSPGLILDLALEQPCCWRLSGSNRAGMLPQSSFFNQPLADTPVVLNSGASVTSLDHRLQRCGLDIISLCSAK